MQFDSDVHAMLKTKLTFHPNKWSDSLSQNAYIHIKFNQSNYILTSTLELSQISAKDDPLPTVSSNSFNPSSFPSVELFMLPFRPASIVRGKSLRSADLCRTTENIISWARILLPLTVIKAPNYQSCAAVDCVPTVTLSSPVLSWHLLRRQVHLFVLHICYAN